jgi:uncharacterized membrane protein YesL
MISKLNLSATSWELVWATVHRVLVVNLGLAVTNLPLLVALAVVAQPWRYPVFFGVLALGLGPSLAAAFGYLHGADEHDRAGVRDFFRAYRRHFGRALGRSAVVLALLGVLVTDVVAVHDKPFGAPLVPLLVVTAVIAVATGVHALALLPLRPELGLWSSLKVSMYSAVRRGWLALLSLVVLMAALAVVNQAPPLGLATVPGFALIVVWANSRAALR